MTLSLRDKLTDRGWVEHDDDLCRGEGVINKDYWSQDADDCPGCVDGLVPPEGMVKELAKDLHTNDAIVSASHYAALVRYILIAAARWEREQ